MGFFRKLKLHLRRKRRINKLAKQHPKKTIKILGNVEAKELIFNSSTAPKVSIIIPFYNQLNYTRNCLHFLHKHLTDQIAFEIILIDDCSNEAIDLSSIKGIRVIKNEENQGFLKNINKGINASLGAYIYILNNDTEVQKGFLEELLYVFENFSNVGAVGSKLLNADGSLQEAGTVFLKGCEIHQIFTKKEVFYPEVNYVKRVDYCSGCSLMFKKYSDNGELNLFDEQFAPAYFEETDFCFQLKYVQNKNIYYNPFSVVVHYDGVTYNASKNKAQEPNTQKEILFKTNLQKFKNKWQPQIDAIQAPTIETRIEELYDNKSLVVFVGVIPAFDKDSGSNRLKEIIKVFLEMGYHVSIIKDKTYRGESDYFEYYQKIGVNVFYEHNIKTPLDKYLDKYNGNTSIAWFYNPDVFSEYYDLAKKHLPRAIFVFDMVDIHHLRYKRALELEPDNIEFEKQHLRYLKIEQEAAQKADYVITISAFEENYMKQFCHADKIITISNIHYIKTDLDAILDFDERKDIVFIGSYHAPNIDALYFLYNDIMPLVWKEIPELKVNIIGNVSDCIKDINNPNFIFRGYVPAIEDYFISSKLMVAPLRYGAGVKGKIGQAFEYFLPVVTTSIGAEGMKLNNNENALITDDKVEFAKAIVTLYTNKEIWLRIQSNSEKSLEPFSKTKLKEQILKIANANFRKEN